MKKSVFGLVRSEADAERVVVRLQEAGFSREDISILFADRRGQITGNISGTVNKDFTGKNPDRTAGGIVHEKHTKAPEGGVTGGVTGGIIGGTLGLLAGIGAIAIPGLGAFIAAGPLMATLSGAAVGGGFGMLGGALIGLGIPEIEAQRYQKLLKEQGNVLISVHTESGEEVTRATEVLKNANVYDICNTAEKTGSPR